MIHLFGSSSAVPDPKARGGKAIFNLRRGSKVLGSPPKGYWIPIVSRITGIPCRGELPGQSLLIRNDRFEPGALKELSKRQGCLTAGNIRRILGEVEEEFPPSVVILAIPLLGELHGGRVMASLGS